MNSIQIEYFLELAKQGNFTDAAKHMFVSQPAVSKQVSAMERELGVILFERSNRGVKITPAGEVLLKMFKRIQSDFDRSLEEARNICNGISGTIHIGCLDGADLKFLPNALKSFQKFYSNINFTIGSFPFTELMLRLNNSDLDLVVTITDNMINLKNLMHMPIFEANCAILISKRHNLAEKQNISPQELANEDFYVIDPEISPIEKEVLLSMCQSYGFTPKNTIHSPNLHSMMLSVEYGYGITVVDESMRIYNPSAFRFIPLNQNISFQAIWREQLNNPTALSFINHLATLSNPKASASVKT